MSVLDKMSSLESDLEQIIRKNQEWKAKSKQNEVELQQYLKQFNIDEIGATPETPIDDIEDGFKQFDLLQLKQKYCVGDAESGLADDNVLGAIHSLEELKKELQTDKVKTSNLNIADAAKSRLSGLSKSIGQSNIPVGSLGHYPTYTLPSADHVTIQQAVQKSQELSKARDRLVESQLGASNGATKFSKLDFLPSSLRPTGLKEAGIGQTNLKLKVLKETYHHGGCPDLIESWDTKNRQWRAYLTSQNGKEDSKNRKQEVSSNNRQAREENSAEVSIRDETQVWNQDTEEQSDCERSPHHHEDYLLKTGEAPLKGNTINKENGEVRMTTDVPRLHIVATRDRSSERVSRDGSLFNLSKERASHAAIFNQNRKSNQQPERWNDTMMYSEGPSEISFPNAHGNHEDSLIPTVVDYVDLDDDVRSQQKSGSLVQLKSENKLDSRRSLTQSNRLKPTVVVHPSEEVAEEEAEHEITDRIQKKDDELIKPTYQKNLQSPQHETRSADLKPLIPAPQHLKNQLSSQPQQQKGDSQLATKETEEERRRQARILQLRQKVKVLEEELFGGIDFRY